MGDEAMLHESLARASLQRHCTYVFREMVSIFAAGRDRLGRMIWMVINSPRGTSAGYEGYLSWTLWNVLTTSHKVWLCRRNVGSVG